MKKRPNRTIEIILASDTLGDNNTPEQNREYALAVRRCVAEECPRYSIAVSLTRRVDSTRIHVSHDLSGEVEQRVREILRNVWETETY